MLVASCTVIYCMLKEYEILTETCSCYLEWYTDLNTNESLSAVQFEPHDSSLLHKSQAANYLEYIVSLEEASGVVNLESFNKGMHWLLD